MFLAKLQFSRRLLAWYDQHRRHLPWRAPGGSRPDPYHALVSEIMLQQTRVSAVVPYFLRFIRRLPTLRDLAAADEQLVLRLWQGLGYYQRARNLRAAAQRIVAGHNGQIPHDMRSLIKLPGIGRYTAGAIASLAYDLPASVVDGNVARVLCRLERIRSDPHERQTQRRLWRLAERILPEKRVGDFNSALMELGATVCTPRSPRCADCPVRRYCRAFAARMQDRIPPVSKAKPTPLMLRRTLCLRHRVNGRTSWLIEQRPPTGRWAGLWQFVTMPADESPLTAATVRAAAGVKSDTPRQIGRIQHALSHRRYRFEVYLCDVITAVRSQAKSTLRGSTELAEVRWVRLDQLHRYPLPRPHLRIAELLKTQVL